ncbi:S-adenosyl-L-methionine-dependent methyltransferases superfamily protein [Theobroma cacao]|uniref:S-adenosyl-L-methionine-dependent methyltransferases superfamily protein n=1 Tax=Theobroma cacao TaxID=3641 RepID=A0A061DFH4_THECC|nr:S-adenosyl-L-methionine-dependent methyltransferases superfamily protein [Theobroma cacao]
MAIGGKSRSNKRSSSVSYASTITTVVFVTLCVFGVWMLTSNSVAPPQTTTTRTAADNNADSTFPSSNEEQITKNNDHKDKAVFEDNPGQLPDDAIKPDEGKSEEDKGSESEDKGTEGGAVEEDPHGLQGKESTEEQEKQSETQISEESVLTQNQQPEENSQKELEDNRETGNEETNRNPEANNNPDSEEDQSQSAEQQQGNEKSKEWQYNQESEDQQQREDKQKIQEVESHEETQETTNEKSKEDDQEKEKNDTTELEEERKGNKQQSQEQQELQTQEIAQTTFSDETKDKQKEILNATQTDAFNILKPASNQETTEKETQSEAQNQETQQQDTPKEEISNDSNSGESLGSSIPKESSESKKSWKTQKTQSENEKERRKDESNGKESIYGYTWQLCNVTAGPDYIPCLDNEKALKKLHSTKHFEHRERHCPEEAPTCLVPLPEGYKRSIPWPQSRDKIWYHNVPHTKLAQVKGHQNWVKVSGEFLTFPGGGTQFIHGARHYIDFVEQSVPDIKWGKHTRVILDVGCGVASFGGFLFDRDVLTMSFAPKDEHEAQVQFALERGIPAISAVMGSQRLPFPSRVFDVVHCARCRVPWHAEGGLLLLELNRVLRPGGYFVWSATPVYQNLEEDVEIWNAMSALTECMCWELVTIKKDQLNSIGAAIYRKPTSNECYDKRKENNPPMCENSDDANAIWHVPLQACMHRVPVNQAERGARWPADWPARLQNIPYWLNSSQMGIYGKPAPQDFARDYEHWTRVVSKLYMSGLGISWSNVRNVMDMRAVYGGFAAALKDIQVWVLNVVNFDSPDTLPIIYERGLFGIYHDWCESFSTYPRSYDLLHADHLFSKLTKRCKLEPVMAEVDRIVRPGGKLIVRDESKAIGEVENLLKSLHWEVHLTFSKDDEGILSAQKGDWRPTTYQASS